MAPEQKNDICPLEEFVQALNENPKAKETYRSMMHDEGISLAADFEDYYIRIFEAKNTYSSRGVPETIIRSREELRAILKKDLSSKEFQK